jgi:soluble lytic murein transglycosylase-like protein
MKKQSLFVGAIVLALTPGLAAADPASLDSLISQHAALNNVPESLVHRVVRRESNYNSRAVGSGGALGLMQIKYATARGMGYTGSSAGLLDADTNLTYAVRYLAGAYRVAGGDHDRSVAYYASGYYYAAKRLGLTKKQAQRGASTAERPPLPDVKTTASVAPQPAAAAAPRGPTLAELR